jgi:chromosomal replication initiator protein
MLEVGLEGLWADTVARLESELSTPSMETWVRQVFPLSLEDGILDLAVPNDFVRQIIASRYTGLLRDVLTKSAGRPIEVHLVLTPKSSESVYEEKPVPIPKPQPPRPAPREPVEPAESEFHTRLNPKYVFEAFVVGVSNRFAHAACQAVAEMPARAYNPLFLYGGVGLGKTHLMHAIAWELSHRAERDVTVAYMSAEKFMHRFISALRKQSTLEFKNELRSVDVLMIDDLQFLIGKDGTQEEFFHTFNALVDAGKQIVVSADKSPSDLSGIEDRLRTRLGCGMVADVHATTYELRMAILDAKAARAGADVPVKVQEFLAQKITSNVRELEGALNRLVAHAHLFNRPVTIETAHEVLHDVLRAYDRKVTIEEIQKQVADHFNIRVAEMASARRARNIVRPRQIAMFLAKQLTTRSLPEIGRKFGNRDHTTVMHAVKQVTALCEKDAGVAEDVELLRRSLMV